MLDMPIDDFFKFFGEPKPYITKPTPKMSFSIKCTGCGYEDTEDYHRQDPDHLLRNLYCPHCGVQTLILVSAIPFTVNYQSRSMREASFFDNVTQECWQCQRKEAPYSYSFSDGNTVKLCHKDFKKYHKQKYIREQKALLKQVEE